MFNKKEYMRKYRQRPKVKAHKIEYERKYRQDHKEYYREYYKKWIENHKEQQKKYNRERKQNLRQKVFEKLGNKCVRCGFSDSRALQIDHVYGHGIKELKELGSGSLKFYNKVLADTKGNYQILCANCNWIKRCENGEYRK